MRRLQPINCNLIIIIDLLRISRLQSPHYIPLCEQESIGPSRTFADKLAEYQPWSLYVRGCRVEWQAACAAKRRSLVVCTIQACRSWPVSELWSAASPLPGFAVRSAGLLAGSIAFPQGKFRRERTLPIKCFSSMPNSGIVPHVRNR